jgi:RNA polymerase sigma-70 factor (ECF subfamily)
MDGTECVTDRTRGRPVAELAARFERDVIPLRGQLYRGAVRLTHHQQDAEDLVQDTILHAYAGFPSFRDGTNVTAWLHRIMHNTWISHWRKRQRGPGEVSVGSVDDVQFAALSMRTVNTFRSAEVAALEAMPDVEIQAAFMALYDAFALTVYYADVEGFSHKEIAELMNTPVGTVMSRLHRGRGRLRVSLLADASRRGYGQRDSGGVSR